MDTRLTTEQAPLPVDDVAGDRVLQVLQHPLFTDEVMLPTRPIDVVFMDVRRAVLLRKPGCVFEGESGIGKTFALNMVKAMLLRQLPALRIYSHDAHNHQIPSIRAFFNIFSTLWDMKSSGARPMICEHGWSTSSSTTPACPELTLS